jgi:hypothetical protein
MKYRSFAIEARRRHSKDAGKRRACLPARKRPIHSPRPPAK